MSKTKRAETRITEAEELFIKGNDLSKSAIFRLGLEITEMCIEEKSAIVTVKTDNGAEQIFVIFDEDTK